MAYYNGYPATYQPMIQPYAQPFSPVQAQPQTAQAQPSVQNGIIWVSGEAGAKAYLVAPNTTVQLWDSESQVIYLKSADASGMPSIKVLDYTIRETARNGANLRADVPVENLSIYATKDEIKAISDQITALQERVNSMTKRRTREAETDE